VHDYDWRPVFRRESEHGSAVKRCLHVVEHMCPRRQGRPRHVGLAQGARLGEEVCLTVYGHLLTRKVIIGLRSRSGASYVMPPRGLTSGLFWYGVFSPLVLLIPAVAVGMIVGMLGGKQGTAFGFLLGLLYAVGMSWFSGYRLFTAYRELARPMQPAPQTPVPHGVGQ